MFLLNLKYSIKIANKLRDLQYKMFLLNQDIIEIADMAEQNLQYKMFLLNKEQSKNTGQFFNIYNTKCSY